MEFLSGLGSGAQLRKLQKVADQAKLAGGEAHVIDSPVVCDHCEFWGFEVDADGRCEYCEEYAGDLLVGLHRD